MKLHELKRGMKIVFKGYDCLNFGIVDYVDIYFNEVHCIDTSFTKFKNDLTSFNDDFTIVKVFDLNSDGEYRLIWDREVGSGICDLGMEV